MWNSRLRRNRNPLVVAVVIGVVAGLAPAQTKPPSAADQAAAIGKAVDAQMAKLQAAIASGNEAEVRKYLCEFQPMLLDEQDAKFDAYQQRLSAGQMKRYGGAFGRQACLKSIMDTCGYSGYVSDALNFATLGNIGGICQELDGTLSNLGDLGLLLGAYDYYSKHSKGELDESTKSAFALACYTKLASMYLGRYGNILGAAANTGYNLGMYARSWAMNDAEATIYKMYCAYWREQAKAEKQWSGMWVKMWEDAKGDARLLKILEAEGFWNDDFEDAKLMKMRNAWALQTWKKDYKAIIARKYFQEHVAGILAAHMKELAATQREKVISSAQHFLREFPRKTITIVATARVVDDFGNRLPVDASRIVMGLYANGGKIADLPFSTQQTSVKINLKDFLAAVGKAKGDFQVEAFWRHTPKAPKKAPNTLPNLGLDTKTGLVREIIEPFGFNLPGRIRFQSARDGDEFQVGQKGDAKSGKRSYIWLGRIDIDLVSVPVKIRVFEEKGKPMKRANLIGPAGLSATTDDNGLAEMPIPVTGEHFIVLNIDGRISGNGAFVKGSEVLSNPDLVVTVRDSQRPAVPPLKTFGIAEATKSTSATLTAYSTGKTSYAQAKGKTAKSQAATVRSAGNASNSWNAYEVARQAQIARQYAIKPGMSPQAAASASKAATAAKQALTKQRSTYFAPFSAATTGQYQTAARLSTQAQNIGKKADTQQKAATASAEALARATQAGLASLRELQARTEQATVAGQPTRFATLAEVQAARKRLALAIAATEKLEGLLDPQRKSIEAGASALKAKMLAAAEIRTSARGLRDVAGFESRMSSTLFSARHALGALDGALTSEQARTVVEMLKWADNLHGRVQIQAAQDVNLMKQYDALAESLPMKVASPTKVAQDIQAAGTLFDSVVTACHKARLEGARIYARWQPDDRKPALAKVIHNGFGADAYEKWQIAEKASQAIPLASQLQNSKPDIDKWHSDLTKVVDQIRKRLAEMRKSGWVVVEMNTAMGKRASLPASAVSLKRLSEAAVRLGKTRDQQRDIKQKSVLHSTTPKFNFDTLLADSHRHANLIAKAILVARAGQEDQARQALQQANDVLKPHEYTYGGTNWELIKLPDALRQETELLSLLGRLKSANRATLVVTVTAPAGVKLADVAIRIHAKGAKQPAFQHAGNTSTYLLNPQTYTVTAKSPGVRIAPASRTITLAAKARQTVTFTAKPIIASGGVTAVDNYNFKNVQASLICESMIADNTAPCWSDDSKYIITPEQGMTRITLAKGSRDQIVTALPDPLVRNLKPASPHQAENPHILGKHVVYLTVDHGRFFQMIVPLLGGKPAKLCNAVQPDPMGRGEQMVLLDVKAGREPAFLFYRYVPANQREKTPVQHGLYVVKGAVPDLRKGKWLGMLPKPPAAASGNWAVSGNWKRVACAEWIGAGRAKWSIYSVPQSATACRLLGAIPVSESVFRLAFSPDGKYIAAVKVGKQAKVVIKETAALTKEQTIASGAITYGTPGWSPDGRFLAMRMFRQGDESSYLMVLQVAGKPVTFKTGTIKASTGSRTSGNGKKQTPPSANTNTTDAKKAYADYIAAYNRLTKLMSQGKGDTPEGRAAYKAYKAEKDRYEATLKK